MVATSAQQPLRRQALAVAVGTFALVVAGTLAAAVTLGLLAGMAGTTPRPVLGTVLLVVAVGSAVGLGARWLADSVVPRLSTPAYLRASAHQVQPLVWTCVMLTGVYFAALTFGEGAVAAGVWFVGVTAAGVAGARWATRR